MSRKKLAKGTGTLDKVGNEFYYVGEGYKTSSTVNRKEMKAAEGVTEELKARNQLE